MKKFHFRKIQFTKVKVLCPTFFQESWQVWAASTNKRYSFKILETFDFAFSIVSQFFNCEQNFYNFISLEF